MSLESAEIMASINLVNDSENNSLNFFENLATPKNSPRQCSSINSLPIALIL